MEVWIVMGTQECDGSKIGAALSVHAFESLAVVAADDRQRSHETEDGEPCLEAGAPLKRGWCAGCGVRFRVEGPFVVDGMSIPAVELPAKVEALVAIEYGFRL